MSSDRNIAWLGKEKERKALELSRKHMKEIKNTANSMEEAVHLFFENGKDLSDLTDTISKHERNADKIKEEILSELSKANYPPFSREKIIRLIMTSDDIADNAWAVGKKLSLVDPALTNEKVEEGLKKLSSLSAKAADKLEKAYETLIENPDSVIKGTKDVERMEEKIDSFRAQELTPALVKWADEVKKPGTSHIMVEIENNMEEIADQAENVADIIRQISLGSR
ncbi:MAG: DUF47 domain-containing protein [Candidatus Hadarchaeota archaeon]